MAANLDAAFVRLPRNHNAISDRLGPLVRQKSSPENESQRFSERDQIFRHSADCTAGPSGGCPCESEPVAMRRAALDSGQPAGILERPGAALTENEAARSDSLGRAGIVASSRDPADLRMLFAGGVGVPGRAVPSDDVTSL